MEEDKSNLLLLRPCRRALVAAGEGGGSIAGVEEEVEDDVKEGVGIGGDMGVEAGVWKGGKRPLKSERDCAVLLVVVGVDGVVVVLEVLGSTDHEKTHSRWQCVCV